MISVLGSFQSSPPLTDELHCLELQDVRLANHIINTPRVWKEAFESMGNQIANI